MITDGTEIPPGMTEILSNCLHFIFQGSVPLCAANARWRSTGVTVAGLSSGLSSTSFTGLNVPRDIFVLKNGTVLVADYYNDRVMKWDRNANVGVLIAGTGSYGSWRNLLARPSSLASEYRKSVKYDFIFAYFLQFEVNICTFPIQKIIVYK